MNMKNVLRGKWMRVAVVMAVTTGARVACGMDADTLGYYDFSDGAVGTSAIGVSIANRVSGATMKSGVVSTTNPAPHVVFSDERPGKYIYSSSAADADLLTENAQSLRLGDTNLVSAGYMTLPGAGKELSQHHDTGFTWEFFFKLNAGEYRGWNGGTFRMPFNQAGSYHVDTDYTLKLYLPTSETDYFYEGVEGNAMPKLKVVDGKWHHWAIIESPACAESENPTLEIYCDGVKSSSKKLTQTLGPITSSAAADIDILVGKCGSGYNNFRGTIAGMRFTKRALATTEFLQAREYRLPEPIADADTVGFYPFNAGTNGQNAVGVTVCNAASAGTYDGTVALSTSETTQNPRATFSDEVPGKYIYANGKKLYSSHKSVLMTSDVVGKSAGVTFTGLGTALSKNHATGNTVEYFIKYADPEVNGWEASFTVDAGYRYLAESSTRTFNSFAPFHSSSDSGLRNIRYCLGSYAYSEKSLVDVFTATSIPDGKWHHIAYVETNVTEIAGVSTNLTRIYGYFDYKFCGYINVGSVVELTGTRNVELGRQKQHAYYSCFRATKRPLSPAEFLVARNDDEIELPSDTVAFYPFTERAAGTSAVGVPLCNVRSAVECPGTATLSTSEDAVNPSATFDSDAPGDKIYCLVDGACRLVCTNPASICVTSENDAGRAARLTFKNVGTDMTGDQTRGHTVEYFFKFVDDHFREWTQNFEMAGGYRFTYKDGTTGTLAFRLHYPFYKSGITATKMPVCLSFGYYDPTGGTKGRSDPFAKNTFDGQWHHLAAVYKEHVLTLYVDRREVGHITSDGEITNDPSWNGTNRFAFKDDWNVTLGQSDREHAKYSCVKVTNRALEPREFLRTKIPQGMMLIVR